MQQIAKASENYNMCGMHPFDEDHPEANRELCCLHEHCAHAGELSRSYGFAKTSELKDGRGKACGGREQQPPAQQHLAGEHARHSFASVRRSTVSVACER